jgi:hypothetical protein
MTTAPCSCGARTKTLVLQQFITDKELGQEDICDFRITDIYCASDDDMNDSRDLLVQVEFTINEIALVISTTVALTGSSDGYMHANQPHIYDIEPVDVAEFDLEKQNKIYNNKSRVEMAVAFMAINQFFEERDAYSDVYAKRKQLSPYAFSGY